MKQIQILKVILYIIGVLLGLSALIMYIFEGDLFFTASMHLILGASLILMSGAIKPSPTTEQEKISRIEIIDDQGRAFVKYGIELKDIIRQDNGRTIKIFIGNKVQDLK